VSGRRSTRDVRRRQLGQNFLADDVVVERFVAGLDLRGAAVVVELGAGAGALTVSLARRARPFGIEVWAVEADPVWAERLAHSVQGLGVRVIRADLRSLRLPTVPYVVAANLPFGVTSDALAMLLDRPERGPLRADIVVQREVAHKHAARPPTSLRTASWAPWWQFDRGMTIDRRSFRPVPQVDAAVLTVTRRDPPVLPVMLAPQFRETLRSAWSQSHESPTNGRMSR
jgi:23S rRNA (adenine-N6)-dimethyltransferase